jgi:L-fuconolactonase
LELFGPQRVMFGSDWPVCLITASHKQVHDAALLWCRGLDDEGRADVFGRTAARWYRL